ncbi:dihydropteroate synthase [Phyllobacterium sp. P30BS-XVII]|uniref:dihydropteroate synthase n=1 Tax=Phyllobacterium sp. P30BS-XVII TaxID=2587046 RepID=UPI0015F8921B|nr:dihydropteroate synthase [Phyllobacterium sp. P30BS-XVII]MBA8902177.1 dihydropteroate synthase [Phyllobacterium sp. P30BS-XVII]
MQREWRLAHGRSLTLGPVSVIMGVLNVTPDSFSDGGVHLALDKAIEGARAMIAEGAAIIDVGGESTRPGATRVDPKTEQSRVLPVIEALAKETDVLISVDTYREETARLAVAAGAHIVNDVWGVQREPAIADLAAKTGAGLVIMHTGRERERDPDVIVDQFAFLNRSLEIAKLAGVAHDQIVLDPGFGFAKETEENLALIRRFAELKAFGYPFLAGTSRKRFLGAVTGRDADERDAATAATSAILRLAGADVFRVHDVKTNRDALVMTDAILQQRSAD